MSNTKPLMPAPGGTESLVGTNPLSIAIPTSGQIPLVLDIGFGEASMGKTRIGARTGKQILWATDAGGTATTDPQAAIDGMLMPVGGHKGFGFALIVDLLCGLIPGGAV